MKNVHSWCTLVTKRYIINPSRLQPSTRVRMGEPTMSQFGLGGGGSMKVLTGPSMTQQAPMKKDVDPKPGKTNGAKSLGRISVTCVGET